MIRWEVFKNVGILENVIKKTNEKTSEIEISKEKEWRVGKKRRDRRGEIVRNRYRKRGREREREREERQTDRQTDIDRQTDRQT